MMSTDTQPSHTNLGPETFQTRSELSSSIEKIESEFRQLHEALSQHQDFSPSPELNHLFQTLVERSRPIRMTDEDSVVRRLSSTGTLASLQHYCGVGEYALEKHWAHRVITGQDRADIILKQFPYYQNYIDLIQLEYRVLSCAFEHPIRKALFIGSGPLCLSGIILAQNHNVSVVGIDHNPEATSLSNTLSQALNLSSQMHSQCQSAGALSSDDLNDVDVVFLAAMVGKNIEEKSQFLRHLSTIMDPHQRLLVRSAKGMRQVLYPQVDPFGTPYFEPISEVHPYNDIVNSFIVLAPKSAQRLKESHHE